MQILPEFSGSTPTREGSICEILIDNVHLNMIFSHYLWTQYNEQFTPDCNPSSHKSLHIALIIRSTFPKVPL